ncbi:hypothetical protein OROMI_032539 [Orobanche minor]
MKMGIEENRSCGKNKVSNESKKNKQRKQKKLSQVQKLYQTCKDVFADCGPGIVPSPDKVEKLAAVLDGMTQADLGIRPDMLFFSKDQAPIITYMQILECDQFSIGIFCLPPTSVIPLHNHPGMTVFSKLLFGTMHIKSCDWSNDVDNNTDRTTENAIDPKSTFLTKLIDGIKFTGLGGRPDGLRLAKIKVNSEFTAPCRTSILYPSEGGNMHRFTAKSACAVLDVLGPPYCDPEGRHCQYYYEFPFTSFSGESLGAPVEVLPRDLEVDLEVEAAFANAGQGGDLQRLDKTPGINLHFCENISTQWVENAFVPEEEKEGYAWLKEREILPEDHIVVGVPYNGPKIAKK